MYLHLISPYVYKVTHKVTEVYYFGYRMRHDKYNRTIADDLWVRYFTSSKEIHNIIAQYGIESFIVEVIAINDDYKECYKIEQQLIKEHITDPLCINKHYRDPVFGKHIFSRANDKTPDDVRKKISKSLKGLKRSPETKEKMSRARATVPIKIQTEEEKTKRRETWSKMSADKKNKASIEKSISWKNKSQKEKEEIIAKRVAKRLAYTPEKRAEIYARKVATQLANKMKR